METLTPCDCPAAGWCPRHHCEKTPHGHMLCHTRPDYFAMWEMHLAPREDTGGDAVIAPEAAMVLSPVPPVCSRGAKFRLPCVHRGDTIRTVPCQLCGRRGQLVEVFACSIHGECTLSRWGTSREAIAMPRCVSCREREEASHVLNRS